MPENFIRGDFTINSVSRWFGHYDEDGNQAVCLTLGTTNPRYDGGLVVCKNEITLSEPHFKRYGWGKYYDVNKELYVCKGLWGKPLSLSLKNIKSGSDPSPDDVTLREVLKVDVCGDTRPVYFAGFETELNETHAKFNDGKDETGVGKKQCPYYSLVMEIGDMEYFHLSGMLHPNSERPVFRVGFELVE